MRHLRFSEQRRVGDVVEDHQDRTGLVIPGRTLTATPQQFLQHRPSQQMRVVGDLRSRPQSELRFVGQRRGQSQQICVPLGPQQPHTSRVHVAIGMGVLHRELGLAEPAQPVDRADHPDRRRTSQGLIQRLQFCGAAHEERVEPHEIADSRL